MQSFLEEVTEDILAKHGSQLHNYAFVFNNKRPAEYIKKHLAESIQKPFWSPQFYTISEFIRESSVYQIADPQTQLFALYDAYIDLLKADASTYLPSIAQFQGIGQIILSDFAQIDMEMVDAQKLFAALEDIAVINERFDFLSAEQKEFLKQFWSAYDSGKHQKMQQNFIQMWQRMPRLYQTFFEKLNTQQLSTSAKIYRQLAEALQGAMGVSFLDRFQEQQILFIGFNALSKAESVIFKNLQESGKAVFYFDTDTYYLEDDLQEAGFFIRKNIQQHGLRNQLSNERSFIKAQHRDLHIYKIQGETAQAKVIPSLLENYYQENNLGQTALVLANENLLIPLLQSIPEQFQGQDVPLNVTMGMGFKNSSLYGLVELWLANQVNYRKQGAQTAQGLQSFPGVKDLLAAELEKVVGYKDVQAFATHPLIGISPKLREKVLTALVKEQLQQVPLTRLVKFGGLAEAFFKEVPQLSGYVQALIELFEYIVSRALAANSLKQIEASLFIASIKELNRLADNLALHTARYTEQTLDIGFISSLILKALQNVASPLEGEVTTGLQVMGLLESRNLNFKNLFILGANEGIMPKGSASSSFIPESLRRAYGLPILEYQDAISAYMFYRLVQRAENIHILYNAQTDEKSTGERSRFISQLAYESGFKVIEKELQLPVLTENHQVLEIAKDAQVMEALQLYLSGKKVISASAFTGYLQNPIDFFFSHVAQLKEPDVVQEQVEANVLGKILHGVMEDFYKNLIVEDRIITSEKLEKGKATIDDLILKHTRKEVFKNEDSLQHIKGMHKVVMAIVKKYVELILKEDSKKLPFQIVDLEFKASQPHTFTDSQGKLQQIKLYGIFDRIDLKDGVYTIIDYKTGGDSLGFTNLEDNFRPEEKKINKALLQTLFYAYIYGQKNPGVQAEVNLYVLRKMSNGEVYFESKKQGALKGEFLNQVRVDFIAQMNEVFAQLFNPDWPFKASTKPNNYLYSIYKTMFGVS